MTEAVDVSIVIPSYNSEGTLRRSVLTSVSQTGVRVEVIVVDDEGQDRTRAILDAIASDNPHVDLKMIYRDGGLGQSTARNAGIEVAKGRYVAFLDSDDSFTSTDILSKWVAEADAYDTQMLIARFNMVGFDGTRNQGRRIDIAPGQVVNVASEPELCNVVSLWQILYRREFLMSENVRFSKHLKQREDRLFVVTALMRADRVSVTPLCVLDHFRGEGSSFTQINKKQFMQYVQHLREMDVVLREARAAGRSNLRFEAGNASAYLIQVYTYWAKTYVKLWNAPDDKPKVQEALDLLRAMVSDLPVLYRDNPFKAEPFRLQVEGNLDLLRLALKSNRDDLVIRLLEAPKPETEMLYELRDVEETAEEVVTRVSSFLRNAPKTKLIAINPSARAPKETAIQEAGPVRRMLRMLRGAAAQIGTAVDTPVDDIPAAEPDPSQDNNTWPSLGGGRIKRLILHVGMPKTGSSSLQQMLERNRFQLLKQGVHYPSFGANREHGLRRERTPGHASLMTVLSRRDVPTTAIERLNEEIDEVCRLSGTEVHTLVLSAENIVSPRFWEHGIDWPRIIERLNVDHVEVACVFRHPVEWLRSSYVEMSGNPRNGFIKPLPDYADDLSRLGLFDYQKIATRLEAPEKVSRLHAIGFENMRANGGIEKWFFDILGVEADHFAPIRSDLTNESQSPAQASVVRMLKRIDRLNKGDIERISSALRDDEALAKPGLTPRLADDLDSFRESQKAHIEAYEAAYGATEHPYPMRPAIDFEGEVEPRIAEYLRSPDNMSPRRRDMNAEFLRKLDFVYDDANGIWQDHLVREECLPRLSLPLDEDGTPPHCVLRWEGGEREISLLKWENEASALVPTDLISDLARRGIYEVALVVTPKGAQSAPRERILKLLSAPFGDEIWPVPVRFFETLRAFVLQT